MPIAGMPLSLESAVSRPAPDALNRFLASVERRALRMAEWSVGSRDEALDIVQDSMLALARSYAHKPEADWAPLFYRILNHRILSWHRQRNRRRRWLWLDHEMSPEAEGQGDGLDRLAGHADTPPALLEAEQLRGRLEAALRALPERQRQAFLLRVWEGMDVRATARAMQCSEGSVKTHLSRAMARLQTAVEEPR